MKKRLTGGPGGPCGPSSPWINKKKGQLVELISYMKLKKSLEFQRLKNKCHVLKFFLENSTFYRSWTPKMKPRSSATHAPESGLISTEVQKSKFHQIWMAVKRQKGNMIAY